MKINSQFICISVDLHEPYIPSKSRNLRNLYKRKVFRWSEYVIVKEIRGYFCKMSFIKKRRIGLEL